MSAWGLVASSIGLFEPSCRSGGRNATAMHFALADHESGEQKRKGSPMDRDCPLATLAFTA